MKSMNKTIVLISIVLLALIVCGTVLAEGIESHADQVFSAAYVAFYSDGEADFECITYDVVGTLYVRNCRLQKKNADGEWETVGAAYYPSARGYNATSFGYTINYASRITSGTYRVAGTFVADGHAITRYSSVRSF